MYTFAVGVLASCAFKAAGALHAAKAEDEGASKARKQTAIHDKRQSLEEVDSISVAEGAPACIGAQDLRYLSDETRANSRGNMVVQ